MDPRISFVTLAVRDLEVTRAFYVDGLGWTPELFVPDEVLMIQVGPRLVLSLWSEAGFEAEVGVIRRGEGLAPLTLAHNVASPAEVDEVLDLATRLGADVSTGEARDWGGYTGYFADPDGFRWEIAHNPGDVGRLVLPPDAPAARRNEHDQPVGDPVPGWTTRSTVVPVTLVGRTVTVEPLGTQHAAGLWQALCVDSPATLWTYLPTGPYESRVDFEHYVARLLADPGLVPMAVVVDGRVLGHACFMRLDPAQGSGEVGHVVFGAALQRTVAATEAMYLMARHVFDDLGYRRFEWKCDALNEPSRRAAARLGFAYEGRFRQAVVYKGRNRDTDWFAMTDADWPALRSAYEAWLDPANFDDAGRQRAPLTAS